MDKINIINYWSYNKNTESNTFNDNLINNLANTYSKNNDLELINLNLLDEVFDNNYWFLCKKTSKLFLLNFQNMETQDFSSALSEINRYTFTLVLFDVNNYNNIIIKVKSIDSFNKKPSRDVRYDRMNILKEQTPIKKRKITDMISATSIRNYMLNDPLLDYLKEYNIKSLSDQPVHINKKHKSNNNKNNLFTDYIMKSGVEFEEELINLIKKDHKVIKVAEFTQLKDVNKLNETIALMRNGEPIIYQGVLHNYDDNTYGLPDLIVRSDYINKLMNYQVIDKEEEVTPAIKLGTKFHYKVIDIKHSTIQLRSDGIHILNSDNAPAYKGQLYIYTNALNKIQGVNINKAFIWGKKYSYESCNIKYNITNFLNKLATINFDEVDFEYVEQTNNGVNWIKTLRDEGSSWSLLPIPSRSEMFPNMKNDKDGIYHKVKKQLSENIDEITQVWNCGVKKRILAHSKFVFSWRDLKFNSKLLNMDKGKIGSTIDKILSINRQNKDKFRPKKINYDRENWFNCKELEFYLDFETFNTNLDSIIQDGEIINENNQYIFMIGVGYEKNKKWIFKSFVMKEKNNSSEEKMFIEFMDYINSVLKKENKEKCKMYHWSHAEVGSYKNFKSRHAELEIIDNHISFYDLNKVFVNEPITVNGALNYSLKTIAKALKKNNLIKSTWDETSACCTGLNAMILANNLYDSKASIDDPVMKEIIYYNEIDCKVLWEIHNLIKKY
jgi:hypothetical protein